MTKMVGLYIDPSAAKSWVEIDAIKLIGKTLPKGKCSDDVSHGIGNLVIIKNINHQKIKFKFLLVCFSLFWVFIDVRLTIQKLKSVHFSKKRC